MLQRTQSAAFLGGAYVFPGGSLDRGRRRPAHRGARCAACAAKNPPAPYWVAAIRECFEEAGVLLSATRVAAGRALSAPRALAHIASAPFVELLENEDLYIPADELAYFGHWITAPGPLAALRHALLPRRGAAGQEGSHDADETVHDVWITPREALERGARGEIELVHATQNTLQRPARSPSRGEACEHARA